MNTLYDDMRFKVKSVPRVDMESKLVGNVEDVAELPGVGQIHRQDVGSTSCIQNIWTIVTESGLKSSRDINFSKVHSLNISDNPIKLHKRFRT